MLASSVQEIIVSCLDESGDEGGRGENDESGDEEKSGENDANEPFDEILFGEKTDIVNSARRQSWIMTSIRFKLGHNEPLRFEDAVFIEYHTDGREIDRIMCDISGLFPGDYRYCNTVQIRKNMQKMRDLVISHLAQNEMESIDPTLPSLQENDRFWKNYDCPSTLKATASLLWVYAHYLKITIDVFKTESYVGTNRDYKDMRVEKITSINGQDDQSSVKVIATILLVRRHEGFWLETVLVIPNTNVGAEYWESTQGCTLRGAIKHCPIRRILVPIDVEGGWSRHRHKSVDSEWKLIQKRGQNLDGWFLENIMDLLCEPPLLRDGLPLDIEEDFEAVSEKRMDLLSRVRFRGITDIEELLDVKCCTETSRIGWQRRLRALLKITAMLWRRRIICFSTKEIIPTGTTQSPYMFRHIMTLPGKKPDHRYKYNRWPVVNLVHNRDGTFCALVHKDGLGDCNVNFGGSGDNEPVATVPRTFNNSIYKRAQRLLKVRLKSSKWIVNKNPDWDTMFIDQQFGNTDYMLDPQGALDNENFRFYHLHIYRYLLNKANSWPFDDKGNDPPEFDGDMAPKDGEILLVLDNDARPQKGSLMKKSMDNWEWHGNNGENIIPLPPYFVRNYIKKREHLQGVNTNPNHNLFMADMIWRKRELLETSSTEEEEVSDQDDSDDDSDNAINDILQTFMTKRKKVHGFTWECIMTDDCHCYISEEDGDNDDDPSYDEDDDSEAQDNPDNFDGDIESVGEDDELARREGVVTESANVTDELERRVSTYLTGYGVCFSKY